MRKIYILLLALFTVAGTQAQISNYSFAGSTGTYTPLVGGTVLGAGVIGDDVGIGNLPIGFTFNYNGAQTVFGARSNGLIEIGQTTVSLSGFSSNALATTANCIAPLWDDNNTTGGSVSYLTTGAVGSRVLTVQFTGMHVGGTGSSTNPTIDCQILLYEGTNVIQFVYGSTSAALTSTTASIGISGTVGSFLSVTPLSPPNTSTVSNVTENTGITSAANFPSGTTYTFTPPPPCTTPSNQPTSLVLTPGATSISGSFTASVGGATNYLVVRTPNSTPPSAPVDGTSYTVGAAALGGVIISNGAATSFVSGGLTPVTQYYYWVYAFNNALCSGGPKYLAAAPLSGPGTTNACSITGVKKVGPTGDYASLTAAMAALVTNGLGGPVTLELQAAYNSSVETFPVVIPVMPCGSPVNNLTIRPELGATALSITSANTTATVDMNGATYVTIDGRANGAGASQLTISNTATNGIALRFINDALFNTVKYTNITGVNTSTTSGVVVFSTTTGTNGNDNNTLDNCDIHDGATLPNNTVYSSGTTATAAQNNSNNLVSNCNIYNYFGATTASGGVRLDGGNTDWTIQNNKFYQTASRTQTTGSQHSAIWVNNSSSGNNFQILGNTIGYNSNAGTGTYTLAGTSSTVFIPVYMSVGTTTASSIQGNTITAIAQSGSSSGTSSSAPFRGIYVSTGLAHVGATSAGTSGVGNTIGSTSATGAITYTSSSASASDVMGMFNFGSSAWVVMNNSIGGFTVSNSSTGAANLYGIRYFTSTTVNTTVTNNTVGGTNANSMQSTSTATGTQVAGLFSSSSNSTVSGNTIRNLTAAGGTGTTTAVSVVGMSFVSTSVNNTVSQNTIYNLANTNTTAATIVTGIHYNSTTGTNLIEKNFIYNLSVASTSATAEVDGIRVASGTATYRNNMIALNAGITNAVIVNGVNETAGTNNFWHNSIYVGGTAAAGTANSFAFNSTVTTNVRSFRNNLFVNVRSNTAATGKNYAVQVGGTAANPAGLTINNNIYYVSGTGTVFGRFNAADVASIAAWKTAVGQDASSLQSDPQYNNPTAATPDLHLSAVNPTPAEGGGVDLGVTDDFDSQVRSGLTPVDIGADAGNFILLDLLPPTITYSALPFTCATTARTLTATITDPSGVPTSGPGLPVLYWKINAGAYTAATGVSLGGNQYQFTFGAGVVLNDVVSYYIVAQDAAATPNVGAFPNTGIGALTANPPAAATPPTNPSTYSINSTMSGTYNVGAGQAFTTLTAAVNAYNIACLAGPVTFVLTDASYGASETFPITVLNNPYASAINTLTIKPGVTSAISGSTTTSILQLSGAKYVTINGSIGSTSNTVCPASAASRDLTITQTNTSTAAGVVWLANTAAGDSVTNSSVQNCVVIGNGPATTVLGIGAGGVTVGNGGLNNNNLSFINNDVRNVRVGIYAAGNSAAVKSQNLVINQNVMTTAAPSNIGETGIFSAFYNNITVSGNTIDNIIRTGSPDGVGINMGFGAVSGFASTTTGIADGVTNVTITNNVIGAVENSGTFSSAGIGLGNTISGTSLIANNFIYGVKANGTSGDFSGGIVLGGGAGQVNVFNNTVSMQGTITGASSATQTAACLAVTAASPMPLNLKNNIFSNTQLGNSGATLNLTAISLGYGAPYTGLTSNNNDLYAAGAGPGTYAVGSTGTVVAGTLRTTLAAWQTETGGDAATQNQVPVFVSATNLHLATTPGSNWCLDGKGVTQAGITADIDCQTRNNPPDIGADEFTSTGFVVNNPPAVCAPATVDLTAASVTTGTVGGVTFAYYTDAAGTTTLANPSAVAVSGTYYIQAINGSCTQIKAVTVVVNAQPGSFNVTGGGTYCAGGAGVNVSLSGSETGVDYQLYVGASPAGSPVPGTGSAISFGNQTAAGTYTVVATNATTSCTANMSGSVTVTINPAPATFTVTGGGGYCSGGPGVNIGLSGSESGVDYQLFNGASPVGSPVAGTGSSLSFGSQTAAGTYTVVATNTTTSCTATMTGSATVTINPLPAAYNVTGGGSYCAGGAGVTVGLSGSEAGVDYQLYLGASISGSAVPGTGAAISFGNQTTAGTYTVVATNASTGCTSTMSGSVNVSVNPLPVIGSVVIQPVTCVSADGAITLNITGAAGPFTFVWTGPGVNVNSQNQTGLTVGSYTVTVTDNGTGCSANSTINLVGPGGCTICPTIPNLSLSAAEVCNGSSVTMTSSSLTNMGVTYGIIFKYSASALADPYTGGTVFATVANGSLTAGGTSASATNASPAPGTYYVYSVLTPTPIDAVCRPFGASTLTVDALPTVNSVSNIVVCNGATAGPVSFSGTPGTAVFNWVNNTPSIGLAASGSGNIGAFTATNSGSTPVTATITVTPQNTSSGLTSTTFDYTGSVQTFTVPAGVTSITIDAYGAQGGAGNAGGGGGGIGGSGGLGSKASGTLSVTPGQVLNIYVGSAGTTGSGGYNGGANGGNANAGGGGGASDVRFPGNTAADRILVAGGGGGGGRGGCESSPVNGGDGGNGDADGVKGADAPTSGGVAGGGFPGVGATQGVKGIGCPSFSGIDGAPGSATGIGGDGGGGQTCCCFSNGSIPGGGGGGGGYLGGGGGGGGSAGTSGCSGNDKGGGGGGAGGTSFTGTLTAPSIVSGNNAGNGKVVISYLAATTTCTGTPTTFTITVNPTPDAVATPSSQTICSAGTITTIALTSAVSGTTYSWTRDNTGSVTGIAASGTGNISGSLTNTTTAPVTVTFTITPSANGCTGTPITATVVVNPTPNAVATPSSQTVCSANAITTIVLSGTVSGTTYTWTRDNTGSVTGIAASGSGNISGTLTNTTAAPVTVTFTITPSANGCPGTPITATVLVNPTPTAVAAPSSQTICSASAITTITLSGAVSGTTYSWTRDNTVAVTGIAASGTGNISGSLTNTTTAPVTVTFTITPSANGCTGAPITATVLVNPTPNAVATPSTQTICTNSAITPVVLSGAVSGTTYSWTRDNNVNVTGIAASGTGNISGTLVNNTTAQQVVTFTITPSANGCTGAPITATVTVNPTPTVTCPANITVNATAGLCGAVVNYPAATATGIPAPIITYSVPSGSTFPVGTTTVNVTATNTCGVATCSFTVTVVDNQAPVITCPANITVTAVGACTAVVNYTVTATDNCPGVVITRTAGLASGSAFPIGVTTVTHRATDNSGNIATCSFTVTVLDGQIPVITAQPVNRTVCAGSNATFSVTATNGVSYQWQNWNGSAWVNVAGATSSSLTLSAVTSSQNTNTYRVIVNGLCSTTLTSAAATLFVNPLPAVSLSTSLAQLQPGQSAMLTATATPAGGNYAWFFNNALQPAASGATYGPVDVNALGTYRVRYTDLNGCVSTSNDVVISGLISAGVWVYPNPNTGQFQVRFYNQPNEQITVLVFASNGQKVYQRAISTGSTPYTQVDVDMHGKPAGVYEVMLVDGSGKIRGTKRIIVNLP